MTLETMHAIAAELNSRKLNAALENTGGDCMCILVSVEYPGYLSATIESLTICCGDAGEMVALDVKDNEGNCLTSVTFPIPSDSDDVQAIANALAFVYTHLAAYMPDAPVPLRAQYGTVPTPLQSPPSLPTTESAAGTTQAPTSTTRAMVPVLLCFDVSHPTNATEDEIADRIRALVIHNIGDIGEEADKLFFEFSDESGNDLDAALYPSDYDWCDTMAHTDPDWNCSR